jgi:hypothetical protein
VNQVSSFIVDSLTKQDRKRQENIFELIYTEKNFVNDIEYVYQVGYKAINRMLKVNKQLITGNFDFRCGWYHY